MSGRRKGTPCGCNADPCGCSPKNHCVKAINNVSPDPNGDFTINAGTGIGIIEGDNAITIVNTSDPDTFVEGKNIEFTPSGDDLEINVVDDPVIDGTLTVNGDIIQNGAAYEKHAEKVYTTNDYIYMRDGAVGGLAAGDFSGFQVIKYDGTNDGRLVIDNSGVARVGDVGDEQPLLTRSESGQLNNGDLLQWNGTSQKAVSSGVNTSQIVRGSGNIGSDTKPVKVVNGVATEVTDELQTKLSVSGNTPQTGFTVVRYGQIVEISLYNLNLPSGNNQHLSGLPRAVSYAIGIISDPNGSPRGVMYISAGATSITTLTTSSGDSYSSIIYMTNDP